MLALLLLLSASTAAAEVRGIVRDTAGDALPGVTVFIKGSQTMAVTDADGRFVIDAPNGATLVAFLGGFAPAEVVAATNDLEITLALALSETMVVTAAANRDAPMSTYEKRPLDIVRTPGAAGDVFRALQVLPGVAKADEGAGLFVRGGDVSEVRVMLDGTTIAHPYRYESPSGGSFGTIEPFLLEGIAFSTGGFSARFGNALSAIVDLRGLGKPSNTAYTASAGLAGLAGRVSLPANSSSGFRASANLRATELLFKVNGAPREFDRYPGGWDVNLSAHYDSPRLGRFKVFAMEERTSLGVEIEREAFEGFLHADSVHDVLAANWKTVFGEWQLSASAGGDRYESTTKVGVVDLLNEDLRGSWRVDLARAYGATVLRVGTDGDAARQQIAGTTSLRGNDYLGLHGTRAFDVDYSDAHAGVFVEAERTFGRFTATGGIRADRSSLAGTWVDPRLNVTMRVSPRQQVRVAWGIYHQAPASPYYDRILGARDLEPMRATHLIAGYELGDPDQPLHVRIEAYEKRYSDLPLDHPTRNFTSDGFGHARGFDAWLQRRWSSFELRASYSFLDAERRWTPFEQRRRFALPDDTWAPEFAVPHAIAITANKTMTARLSLGAGWQYSTGRPFTPIVGATRDGDAMKPIYGTINSDRLPAYTRFDFNSSYRLVQKNGRSLVAFASVSNLFARKNSFEYAYSADYSQRTPVTSAAPRSFYAGITITR